MLDLTIYCYGYSEIIFHTLQAIAMFRGSGFYLTVITTISLTSGLIYALRMVGASGADSWRGHLRGIIVVGVFTQSMLLPTTTMTIKDNVENTYQRVDNIPLAFALPVGIVENFGHILTQGFEQTFSLVGSRSSYNYYNYGTVFGARLKKEVLQTKIRDPEFSNNMYNFIERCVILPAMIGNQFTKEELVASNDMWGLVKNKAGTFTRVQMTENGERLDPHPTCKVATIYFERKFQESFGTILDSIAWKFKGAGKDNNLALNDHLKNQIQAVYGGGTSVETVLKQNMMINALNDYRSGSYANAKAQLHHEASGIISGDLAEKTLTGSLAVMKVMIYGSFIFLLPLLLLSGGIAKYQGWITAVFSLALWPSLFSMLNMIIDFAYEPSAIVSYSSWSSEVKKFDSIASTAANLTLMIPFLSFWITRMAEGGFVHLAGSIMAGAQSASSSLASERASGSKSWDNESMRNHNSDNLNSNKHDSSRQYVSGSARTMQSDGSMESITPGGDVIFAGGAGSTSSTGESSYSLTSGLNASAAEGIKSEQQAVASDMATRSKTKENIVTQEASILESIAKNTRSENGWNINTSTEEGKELVKSLNNIDRMTKENGYSWSQNAEAYLRGSASTPGLMKTVTGLEATTGGGITNTNGSEQKAGHSSEISTDTNTSDKQSTHNSKSGHESWLSSIGVDQNKQNSLRESYNEVDRLDSSISQHKDNIDSYHQTLDYIQNHGQEYRKDCYQHVLEGYQEKYKVSAADAQKAVSAGSIEARAVFNDLSGKEFEAIRSKITHDGGNVKTSNLAQNFYQDQDFKQNEGGLVEKEAEKQGFNGNESDQINKAGRNLAHEVSSANINVESNHKNEQQRINSDKEVRMTTTHQYEQDRMGSYTGIGGPAINNNANLNHTPVPHNEKPQRPPEWSMLGQKALPNTAVEIPKIDRDHAENISNNSKKLTIPFHLKPED